MEHDQIDLFYVLKINEEDIYFQHCYNKSIVVIVVYQTKKYL